MFNDNKVSHLLSQIQVVQEGPVDADQRGSTDKQQ